MSQRGTDVVDDYKERYVAFLDLLGFKAQVENAERDPVERAKLRQILELVRDTVGQNSTIGLRLSYLSDCLVISTERTAAGLWEVFQSVSAITCNLLQYDVLVRGGITGGGAHHGSDFLYGTAVNRAYLLESESAIYPMTLLAPEVLEDARAYGEQHMRWLAEETPPRHFVHYLLQYATYRPKPLYQGMVMLEIPGRRIMDFVCQRLNRDNGRVLAKAEWLQAYWNQTVASAGVFGTIELGVTERFISDGPTIVYRRMYMPNVGSS
jgi:hypothetical protein